MFLRFINIVVFLSFLSLYAQKEANNWYFGDRAGITFNTEPPSALTNGQMYTNEGCASISAPNGRLLFYTDGVNVWDSTHNTMPNGTGLNGSATSTQSAIIVPKPENPLIYYIFTVAPEAIADGLQYSEVDMSLNSGKGDIVSTRKNIKLKSQVAEKITAVQKKNSKDFWVLAARFYSDSFFAFSVTKTGVAYTPVSYRTGFTLSGAGLNSIGYLKISPNGKKVAFANNTFDTSAIGDFDAATGKIYNLWRFYSHYGYGIEFSPKSKYLYTTETGTYKVFQYDLAHTSKAAFIASKTAIDSNYSASPGALQLGPDGKIYVSQIASPYLSVIHTPDSSNCRSAKDYIYLKGRWSHYGLPTFIQSFFQDTTISVTRKCITDSTMFSIADKADMDSVRWNFDDPSSGQANTSTQLNDVYHIYQKTGYYTVKLTSYRNSIPSTISVKFYVGKPVKPILGRDTSVCNAFTLTLTPQKNFGNYLWSPSGSNKKSIIVTANGKYILNAKDSGECWSADTILINNPKAFAQLKVSDTVKCLEGNFFDFKTDGVFTDDKRLSAILYFEDNTFTTDSVVRRTLKKSGKYIFKLVIESNLHCKDSMIKTVEVLPKSTIFLGNDTTFCKNISLALNAGIGFKKYRWSTGDTLRQIMATKSGKYIVNVMDLNNCPAADTIVIKAIASPVIHLKYDSVTCKFVYLIADSLGGATYLWNTGETSKTIGVVQKGLYIVTANHQFCSNSDSVFVNMLAMPEVSLGPDTNLCANEIVLTNTETGNYLWSNAASTPSIVISQPGKYWLTVSRNNCSATDSVNVKLCEEMIYFIPTAFTPNDDNMNEVFKVYGANIAYIEMEIFNRWGELLYKSEGKDPSWNGTYKNESCEGSVYFYKLYFRGEKHGRYVNLKGSVMLLR